MRRTLLSEFPDIAAEFDYDESSKTPADYAPFSNQIVPWKCIWGHKWWAKINNRTRNHTGCPYCAGILPITGENDLKTLYPIIASQWHPWMNGENDRPEQYLPHSNAMKYWRCERGHDWQARIDHRVDGRGCPYCAGTRPIEGENDFQTLYPVPAGYWDYRGNKTLPSKYLPKSHAKKKWRCLRGHSWTAPIESIVRSYELNPDRSGCPYCAGKQLADGDSLLNLAPILCEDWDYEKNLLTPDKYPLHSNETVGWVCRFCSYKWDAKINNRVNGTGCPACHHTVVTDLNSVMVNDIELSSEWDYDKNGTITPAMVAVCSNKAYWWRCPENHSWRATVANRHLLGEGCPYCMRTDPVVGKNDLKTCNPVLSMQWNKARNGSLTPEQVFPTSNRIVWWLCEFGHEWKASVFFRNLGAGCPYCSGLKPIEGKDDLRTCNSVLSMQWNRPKNGTLTPEQVFPTTRRVVWWKCELSHEWKASVYSRNLGAGCPYCEGKVQTTHKLISYP